MAKRARDQQQDLERTVKIAKTQITQKVDDKVQQAQQKIKQAADQATQKANQATQKAKQAAQKANQATQKLQQAQDKFVDATSPQQVAAAKKKYQKPTFGLAQLFKTQEQKKAQQQQTKLLGKAAAAKAAHVGALLMKDDQKKLIQKAVKNYAQRQNLDFQDATIPQQVAAAKKKYQKPTFGLAQLFKTQEQKKAQQQQTKLLGKAVAAKAAQIATQKIKQSQAKQAVKQVGRKVAIQAAQAAQTALKRKAQKQLCDMLKQGKVLSNVVAA